MIRFFCLLKITFLGILLMTGNAVFAQTITPADIFSQIPADVRSNLTLEEKARIEGQIKTWIDQGLTEEEIRGRLEQEKIAPPKVEKQSKDGIKVNPQGTKVVPTTAEKSETSESPGPEPIDETEQPTEAKGEPTKEEQNEDAPLENPSPQLTPGKEIFGHRIFATGERFNDAANLIPSFNYIIGPGDVFNVNIWGCNELNTSLTVDEGGSVFARYVGKVYVAGLSYGKARSILLSKYRNQVSSCSEIEVFLGQSQRNISVNIVGEVIGPGAYKINSALPAFHAIFMAGGVSPIGSVRNIEIRRGGRLIQTLDIYDYLIAGKEEPVYLQDNDFIFVPVQGRVVRLSGEIKRPMRYELREAENLKALLVYAGGLTPNTRMKDAQIARLADGKPEVINFDLDHYIQGPEDQPLKDGDEVLIKTIKKERFYAVRIMGSVKYPDTYQLLPGDRVKTLIERAGGLEKDAYTKRAYVIRTDKATNEVDYLPVNPEALLANALDSSNLELKYFDIIQVFSERDFTELRNISVSGYVRKPGSFQVGKTMSLKDVLYMAGGIKEDADFNNIELSQVLQPEDVNVQNVRTAPGRPGPVEELSGETLTRRIAIPENWEEDPSLDTVMVYDFNQIRVYSKYDFIFLRKIQVGGAVQKPGIFQLKRGMTLKDALYLAGGLQEYASVEEIELFRDLDPDERGINNLGTGRPEIVRVKIDENWRESRMADSILVGSYRKILVHSETEYLRKSNVMIKGLVKSPGEYEVLPEMTLKDLLYMSGGLMLEADHQNIELTRVMEQIAENGEVIPVPIVVNRITTLQNWREDPALDEIKVNSFDQVFVRKNPDFELQESVFVEGEVFVPGEYNKIAKAEKLSSLVARAGGITDLAYTEGAVLDRPGIGPIAIKLEKALRNPNSKFDIPIQEGDRLIIPPRLDLVQVNGNVLKPGVNLMFESNHKRFKYYVRLAGGFAKRTKRKECTVTYVDGRVKRTRQFLGIRLYPKVAQGSILEVAQKEEKEKKERDSEDRASLSELLAGATAILTFYLLIDRSIN